MKRIILPLVLLLSSAAIFCQQFSAVKIDVSGYASEKWGTDVIILNHEPLGTFSGVQRSNGTIYLAVNDTLLNPGIGLAIFTSTNLGVSWQIYGLGIPIRDEIPKIKMLRSSQDSIYCMFMYNTYVYCWNIEDLTIYGVHAGNYRSFDAVASNSTGSLYLMVDSLLTNSIIRYGSTDGGRSWINRGTVTSAGAFPQTVMSTTGDTLILNYYGPVLADTLTSIIRAARYRETGAGLISSSGFQDVATSTNLKMETVSAIRNGEVVFAYTSESGGNTDIYFRKSTDNGLTYLPEEPLANSATRNEYWMDIKAFQNGTGGFDIIYYSDSLTAVPTVVSDKLFYGFMNYGTPLSSLVAINNYPIEWTPKNHIPKIVELFYSADDAGVVYVGKLGDEKRLVWDFYSSLIPVELASFTGYFKDGNVVLNWVTSSEKNNAGFEIQRNISGTWQKIGFVKGSGTSTEKVVYIFADKNILSGTLSYRLKQIDLDGRYTYSEMITVDSGIPGEYMLAQNYPNPFNPSCIIRYSIPEKQFVSIKIMDILGKEICRIINEDKDAGTYEVTFDASNAGLTSGMYLYTITAGNFRETRKMLFVK